MAMPEVLPGTTARTLSHEYCDHRRNRRHRLTVDEEAALHIGSGAAVQHLRQSPLAEQSHPTRVECPGPLPRLDVFALTALKNDAVDAVPPKKIADRETGHSRPDNDDRRVFPCLDHVATISAQLAGYHR
jgi:hypothetical protein